MIKLEGLSWTAPDNKKILDDLSLEIQSDKLTVITGPNGGGKTTLAKMIAGLETPDSGKIYLDSEDITNAGITERAKMGISYAFQQPVRFKGITVRRLLCLSAGYELKEGELCDALGAVGLCAREYIDREINATLSGGEIKRIEIASVLLRKTKVSIFDEPEAGIDLWSFTNLIKAFEKIRDDIHGTMIIISHQERILKIADRIVVVENGRIKESGNASDMMPKLVSGNEMKPSCAKQEEAFS